MTMNTSWGYNQHDEKWKSSQQLIQNLVDVVSKGGNYLLNVGPMADGSIPAESVERMKAIGDWMEINSASIYGTEASPFGLPEWGRYTTKSGTIYAHVFDWPETGTISVADKDTLITRAYLIADENKSDLKIEKTEAGWIVHLPKNAPDENVSVVVLEQ